MRNGGGPKICVTTEIKRRGRENLSLSHSDVHREDPSLMNGAVRRWGSWRDAVAAAGVDYEVHYRGWQRDTTLGIIFENLVDELFRELEREFHRTPAFPEARIGNFVRPDFVFAGNEWWDAKLNAHAPHVDDCIERYSALADSLTIICLRGAERSHTKVNFIGFEDHLNDVSEDLKAGRVAYYRNELAKIRECKAEQKQLDEWALRWTRESILEEIEARGDAGESLLSKDVSREQPDLYGAVTKKRYFESWYDAVTCAGFDGDGCLKPLGSKLVDSGEYVSLSGGVLYD